MKIHIMTPFSRYHLLEKLIAAYRPLDVIWHPLTFKDRIPVAASEPWVQPFIANEDHPVPAGYQTVSLNMFIDQHPIVDDDYYVTAADDDMYEPEVFKALQEMDDPVVIISMKRGYNTPEGTPTKQAYPPTTLTADPENMDVGLIGGEQIFMKGSVLKAIRFNEKNAQHADGLLARHLKKHYPIKYRPDIYALFNYYEPGRWEKMKITNQHLAIGVPCTFPTVPTSFFYSFVYLERPSFTFIHADNGPIDTLRNDLVMKALEVGATNLIMMDVDMIYDPQTITKLLAHRLPVVGALCFRRYPPFDSILLKDQDGGYVSLAEWEEGALIEVDATGAGCLMFDMEVFRQMPYPWFKFQKDADTGAIIGEDIGFCKDLKKAGYKIFVDTSVSAAHLTTLAINRQTSRLYRSMKIKEQQQALERALSNGSTT